MKILVVDDEPTILEVASELLTSAGYNVLIAKDGRRALDLAREEQPVLIVLDLLMPGMSGIDVVREIRNDPRLKNTPILIMSRVVPGNTANEVLRGYGIDCFISKDNLTTSLVSLVRHLLSKQTPRVA